MQSKHSSSPSSSANTSLHNPHLDASSSRLSDQDSFDTTAVEYELLELYDSCQSIPVKRRKSLSSTITVHEVTRLPVVGEHSYPCNDTYSPTPKAPPSQWPQRPILLRPSPDSCMRIIGIRYSASKQYVPLTDTGFCLGCTLPINNGYEKPGDCLVVDFETEIFIGTAMLRIKNIDKSLSKSHDNKDEDRNLEEYYFHKRKRTFQAIVRGRFKVDNIPMSECITGQVFNRPAGNLPPKLIVKGAVAMISHLTPQLQTRLEGDCPRFLSPLVSTAQTALVHRNTNSQNGIIRQQSSTSPTQNEKSTTRFVGADESLEVEIHEPQPSDPSSLLHVLMNSGGGALSCIPSIPSVKSSSIQSRTKIRKKAFDKLFARRIKTPTFDTNAEYTFEFFQHLISFEDFALDFAKPIGKHSLSGILYGQPLKFMAAHQVQERDEKDAVVGEDMRWLWSFELWHESLYRDGEEIH